MGILNVLKRKLHLSSPAGNSGQRSVDRKTIHVSHTVDQPTIVPFNPATLPRSMPSINVLDSKPTLHNAVESSKDANVSLAATNLSITHRDPRVRKENYSLALPPALSPIQQGSFQNATNCLFENPTFVDAPQTINIGSSNLVNGLELLHQHTAPNAPHNSAARFDAPKCDEDTRVGVIEEIMGWLKDKDGPTRILCMTGPAGTGKSALEQTIALECETQNILAASFFFWIGDSSRNNKSQLVATLVYQITQSIRDLRKFVSEAVQEYPSIFTKSLEKQLDVLLVRPLQLAEQHGRSHTWPYVILIDGLDECEGMEHQAHVLHVIYSCFITKRLPFRIFLASRPEYAMRTALAEQWKDVAYHLVLDGKYNPSVDIQLYLQRRLTDIGKRAGERAALAGTWPSLEDISTLVGNASGQFIYAATIVKFVSQRQFSPVRRLNLLLTWDSNNSSPGNPFGMLDVLYIRILTLARESIKGEVDDSSYITHLLGKIRALDGVRIWKESYNIDISSIAVLESFPFLMPGEIARAFIDLHALIDLSNDQYKFHHKSFGDFLRDPKRSGPFYVSKEECFAQLSVAFLESQYTYYTSNTTSSNLQFTFHKGMDSHNSLWLLLQLINLSIFDDRIFSALGKLSI